MVLTPSSTSPRQVIGHEELVGLGMANIRQVIAGVGGRSADYTEDQLRAAVEAHLPQTNTKVVENRLRRAVERQGFQLRKSRRRDPSAYDYGLYWITDPDRNWIVSGERGMTLAQVETWLHSPGERTTSGAEGSAA
jgi:hypothetical protein